MGNNEEIEVKVIVAYNILEYAQDYKEPSKWEYHYKILYLDIEDSIATTLEKSKIEMEGMRPESKKAFRSLLEGRVNKLIAETLPEEIINYRIYTQFVFINHFVI